MYSLTGSTFAVGLISAFELVPRIVLAPVGGLLADTVDRRLLAIVSNGAFALLSAALVTNALMPNPSVGPLYVFAIVAGGSSALYVPSIRAWPARLVEPALLPAAFAIEGASYNANALIGPAVAGLLIASFGVATAYTLDVVTFAVAVIVLWGVRASRPSGRAARVSILDGFRVIQRQPIVRSLFGLDLTAMFFGMPLALLPALAQDLGLGPALLGLLFAAPATGGLIATALSGGLERMRYPGRWVVVALCIWSGAIVVLGFAGTAWLAWVALAVAGAGNNLSAILGNSIMQTVVPDDVRGRLAAADDAISAAGPALGDIESGAVATWIGVGPTIALGGVLSMVGVGVLALVGGSLRRYRLASSGPPE